MSPSQARKRRNIRRAETQEQEGFDTLFCVIAVLTLGAMLLIGATA